MSEANYSIDDDLKEAQAMAKGLESYLQGSELYGRVGGMFSTSMLTIGTLLMRLRRLRLFRDQMAPMQQSQLDAVEAQHETIRKEWRTHYDAKLVKEANSRLDGISAYFQEINESQGSAAGSYKPEALRRTVVQEILDAMEEWRIHSADLDTKVRRVDSRLRGLGLQPSDFIWASALEPAYPQKVYWWLYSKPRKNP
jgi:uncharacterized membrane-anchored protein YhcB (DUF1043 family)